MPAIGAADFLWRGEAAKLDVTVDRALPDAVALSHLINRKKLAGLVEFGVWFSHFWHLIKLKGATQYSQISSYW